MARDASKNHKSLSEKLRSRLMPSSTGEAWDEQERGKIEAIAEGVEQGQFSTIARAMSEGSPGRVTQSRAVAAVHRILEQVEEHPGCDVHQLAQCLGEKSILILSHVDELVREGVLLRLEQGRLYRSRDVLPVEEGPGPALEDVGEQGRQALEQVERTKMLLRVFRFLTSELGLEPECGRKMTVLTDSGKFFEMRPVRDNMNISLYGMFPKKLVERFKRDSNFGRRQINYSHLTGIIDIRGCRLHDLETVLPWVAEFYRCVVESPGDSESE